MKICAKCGQLKPTTEFYKAITRDGLRSDCKTCARSSSFAWYTANQEKAKASRSAWAAKNTDKTRAAKTKWRTANPEKMRACRDRWVLENPERARAQQRLNNRNRKSRLATGRLSTGIIKKLLLLQRGKCVCCGLPLGDDYHLDHIMPLALGGANTDDNIQLLRATCNHKKSAKHPIDFMQQRGFLL